MNAQRNNLDANEGFAAQPLTADLARHQLHMSLGVMGVVLAAGFAMFSTFDLAERSPATELRAEITVQQPHIIRPMTAQTMRNEQSGG